MKFSINKRNGEKQYMEHYFCVKNLHVLSKYNEDTIMIEFDRFINRAKSEIIEAWSDTGSGIDLPQKLKTRKR